MKFKKFTIIILVLLLIFECSANAKAFASEPLTDQAEDVFLGSNVYQKTKKNLISSKPVGTKELADKEGKIKNEILIYKINTNANQDFNNKNATGTVSTIVESPLVVNYDVVNKKISSAIIFDYSTAVSNSNKIEVTNLLNDESIFISTDKLGDNVATYVNNIKTGREQTVEDTTENVILPKKSNSNAARSKFNTNANTVTCSIFTCTKYKSGGGNWSSGCQTFAGLGCSVIGSINKWASIICEAGNAIGCYVPKYKVCVKGNWKNYNVCPART